MLESWEAEKENPACMRTEHLAHSSLKVVSKPLLTTAEACIWFLPVLNNPGHITAAPGALPREYQHAGVNFGGNFGDSCHIPAAGAPNTVENHILSISGYTTPDIFGFGCKIILWIQFSLRTKLLHILQ